MRATSSASNTTPVSIPFPQAVKPAACSLWPPPSASARSPRSGALIPDALPTKIAEHKTTQLNSI